MHAGAIIFSNWDEIFLSGHHATILIINVKSFEQTGRIFKFFFDLLTNLYCWLMFFIITIICRTFRFLCWRRRKAHIVYRIIFFKQSPIFFFKWNVVLKNGRCIIAVNTRTTSILSYHITYFILFHSSIYSFIRD